MKRTPELLVAFALLLGAANAQQVFDPFAGPKPQTGVSDGPTPEPTPAPTPAPIDRKPIGFTWWNDGPAMVEEGNKAYADKRFAEAEVWYQDARLASEEHGATVEYNQALALAQQKKFAEAASGLSMAMDRAGQDAGLRTDALYSRGTAKLMEAQEAAVAILAMEQSGRANRQQAKELEEARREAVELCLGAIDDFSLALERRTDWDDAVFNRAQAQHLLDKLTKMPPEESQQQQQQQQDGEGDQNQDPQQDGNDQQQEGQQPQQNDEQQEQQQNDQQSGQDQQQGDQQQESQNQQSGDQNGQPQQGSAQQGSEQSAEMTAEQATALLEMLGNGDTVRLLKRSQNDKPRPAKDW